MRIELLLWLLLLAGCSPKTDGQTPKDTTDRVIAARNAIGEHLKKSVLDLGARPGSEVFLRAFKREEQLELWLKKDSVFHLFKTYKICYVPGRPGPKRKQGDFQVPEGVYCIDLFNPESNYHLSMRINYPNQADLYFADKEKPGGDIYIHGACASIGCIPIEDANIEEVYLLAWDAKINGQEQIPVHIFPCRLNDKNLVDLVDTDIFNRSFWENLRPVYDFFEEKRRVPDVAVNARGRYEIQN